MRYILPHEQLHVYSKAMAFAKLAGEWVDSWSTCWAVRNQLDRAMESIVANLARAARYQRTDKGTYLLECSLGSVLECAACVDIAQCRRLIDAFQVGQAKLILREVARMEVGLRKSWTASMRVREESETYSAGEERFFRHESLDVYQRSLQLHGALGEVLFGERKEHRHARRVDELTTSLTLNIAEGNGRFSKRDHGTFVDSAEDAATKLAAYLDLVVAAWGMELGQAKALLRETLAMLEGLRGYLES